MIIVYFNPEQKHHRRILTSMFRSHVSSDKKLIPSNEFNQHMDLNNRAKLLVFAGMIRGEGLIYKWCVDNNKQFLYVDHAYINRGYKANSPTEEWMRVTHNSMTWNQNVHETSERWNYFFKDKHKLSTWCGNKGKNILVLPPSNATKYIFPESERWVNETVEAVRIATKAPVIIREKPEQPLIDSKTNAITGRQTFSHDLSIDEEIARAKVIITYNSAVPVTGIIRGVPCISSIHGAAYPMNTKIKELDNPPEPDRQGWLNQLVHHQFTGLEIKKGLIWPMLRKYGVTA